MKITVITGSPRKHGNSFAMTDAFIREAETLGHTVRRFQPYRTCHYGSRCCCIHHANLLVFHPGTDKGCD